MEKTGKLPCILLAAYIAVFTVLGINPYDRAVWWAENLPIILIVVSVILITKFYYRFSNLSYILMSVLIFMHTVGGHYTFARVPFGFITELFNFSRNHYDRVAHFSVGFYAYPIAEMMLSKGKVNSAITAAVFGIFAIFTIAAVYEIFEWQFALMAEPDAGLEVLGSQGDVWDAQKDMLADGLGGIFSTILFLTIRNRNDKHAANNRIS
jgi:putative membrane protein